MRPPRFDTTRNSWSSRSPTGITRRPGSRSCSSSAGGNLRRAGGHRDRVVGRRRRIAQRAVAADHRDVARRGPCARRFSRASRASAGNDLHRHHARRQRAQHRGGISAARADLQHRFRSGEFQHFGHQRRHVRLRNGLPVADRDGVVACRPATRGSSGTKSSRGISAWRPARARRGCRAGAVAVATISRRSSAQSGIIGVRPSAISFQPVSVNADPYLYNSNLVSDRLSPGHR